MKGMAQKVSNFGRIWGFDSFEGLPAEANGVHLEGWHWRPGAFSAADALEAHSFDSLTSKLRAALPPHRRHQARYVRGFFNESLTTELLARHRFQPALIIDVDVDLYSSTIACLGWMLRSNLLVPGTLVRYDDWKEDPSWGETRGHAEITRRFGLVWKNISFTTGSYAEFQLISRKARTGLVG